MLFTHSSATSKPAIPGIQPIVDRTTEFKRHKQKSTSTVTMIPITSQTTQNNETELNNFISQTRQVREWLARLKQLTQSIEHLHKQILMAVSIDDAKRLTAFIDAQVAEHMTTSTQIRYTLKQLGELAATARDKRIQSVTIQKLSKDFFDRMVAFREMQTTYQSKYKSQLERQYLIVRPTATRVELDRLADVENPLILSQQVKLSFNDVDVQAC